MSIRFRKYVDIISGVAGSSGVRRRDLIGRIFTQSPLIGTDEILEFTDAASVALFFGDNSPEHLRALFYFAWASPSITAARRISFARHAPLGSPIRIFGDPDATANLATFQAITAGALTFQFGTAAPVPVSGIDLSAAVSLAGVASAIQTALNANADLNLSGAVVTYDAPSGTFAFSNSISAAGTVAISTASPLSTALGWGPGARFVNGSGTQSGVQAVTKSVDVSDNFGSIAFITDLDLTGFAQVAAYVAGENVKYQLMVPLRAVGDASAWSAALVGFAGTALTLAPTALMASEFPELIPMTVLAATDYDRRNATMNYMFKSFGGLTASVNDDATSDSLDAMRVNYYGRTQTAGQNIQFYQRGFLMGTPADPLDMNVFGNEQWLKDFIGSDIMSLLISTNRVPANATGRGQILAIVQGGIDAAILNGTISIGKPLTIPNKLFITQQTGDELAWHQVQNNGYWVDCVIQLDDTVDPAQWKAVYQLIYSKDDAIRFVQGTHFLI